MQLFKSEILSKQHLEALNGTPFWVIKKASSWLYPHDYQVWHVPTYNVDKYPIVHMRSMFRPSPNDPFISRSISFHMSLVRQLREESRNEKSYALWDFEELKHAVMVLKLKGYIFDEYTETIL